MNKELSESKILYEALDRVGFSTNPQDLLDKINQLSKGLPKEDEFIAANLWIGKCIFIKKLCQETFPESSKEQFQVPDIFAIYENNNKKIPVFIEVKSTVGDKKLRFSKKYYEKLKNYALLFNMPLLLAWNVKRLGLWALVDFNEFKFNDLRLNLPPFRA